jgi:hypothetical protein
MKNKKEEQEIQRQKHKAQLKLSKRQSAPHLVLGLPIRKERQRILIVCEGENTEPSYFRQFRLSSAEIMSLGIGASTLQVVNRANNERQKRKYDQVWVVFDKDDFPAKDFNAAIELAEKLGFGVAYSNQAFEYWLILHFEDHQGNGLHRDFYNEKLNFYLQKLKIKYDGKGTKIIKNDLFDALLQNDPNNNVTRVQNAINRASKRYNELDHRSPALEESSTTVFRLVEEIMKFV